MGGCGEGYRDEGAEGGLVGGVGGEAVERSEDGGDGLVADWEVDSWRSNEYRLLCVCRDGRDKKREGGEKECE